MKTRSPVVVAGLVAAALVLTSGQYGYHRDELYFRFLGQHPAWGYVDQPPGTPMIARAAVWLFGDTLWGLRLPSALAVAAVAMLLALIAREVGAGAVGQSLAAVGAAGTGVLVVGHVLTTVAFDAVVWLAVLLFAARALLRADPRWWVGVGVTAGVGMWNKLLVVLLILALLAALAVAGPREALRSRWLWIGFGIGAVIALPNAIYQVVNDFPQLSMAAALAENKGDEARALLVPFQIVAIGLPLFPVLAAGVVCLLRRPQLRPIRAFAVAYLLLLPVLFVMAAQPYYAAGLALACYAVGAAVTENWARSVLRRVLLVAAVVVNVLLAAAFALPVFPLAVQETIGLAEMNQVSRDQIGWPEYTRQVAEIAATVPGAAVITSNYGEHGALHRYGPELGMDTGLIFSGQNELHRIARPADGTEVVVLVGVQAPSMFDSCRVEGRLDSGWDIENEEQGVLISVCRGPVKPWTELWPAFQHYD
ncbi:glycosyltransferase family 39 protein [Actinoplanes sp. NPDC051861]|uniref:ArnT family glycosyltransferase n=1 Tax=Actinoplanes sp. NPDC051861 TaxID=3155170 RepID=UPI00344884AC